MDVTFLEQFSSQYGWQVAPAKRRFRYRKEVNKGMRESHRLALTMRGVIDRALDDLEGLQASDYSTYQIFEEGDLAFKLIDLENIKTSRVGLVPRRGIMSPAYVRLIPNHRRADSRFYAWFFFAVYFNNIFNGMGGGVRQNLTPTDLLEFPIPLPDLATQRQIADFLDRETARIDLLIEKKQRFIDVLSQKWAATVTSTLTNGLNRDAPTKKSGVSWIGDIPAHWNIAKLGHIGRSANGINIGGDAFGSGYPFVSYSDVYRNTELPLTVNGLVQSSAEDRMRYTLKAGDVLFTRTSETIDEIGFSSVCIEDMPEAVFAGFLIRFRPTKGKLAPLFSKFLFRNERLRAFFSKEMMIVTRASLSQGLLQRMPVVLPPIEEQEQIAKYLQRAQDTFLTVSQKTKISINRLKEYRSALITAAVTGQIDVHSYAKSGTPDRRLDAIQEEMEA
ncbi:restriction endonuclease subunit S [Yoonia sp.]|uniref:restriction endonuclease subunit S n=1 Tax=Yoonia sp. TaxID=2212373 RepID=UPI00358E3DEC